MFLYCHSSAFVCNDSRWWISVCIIILSFIRMISYSQCCEKIVPIKWHSNGNNNLIFIHLYSRSRQFSNIYITIIVHIYYCDIWRVYVKKESGKTYKNKSPSNGCRLRFLRRGNARFSRIISGDRVNSNIHFHFVNRLINVDIGDQTMAPNTIRCLVCITRGHWVTLAKITSYEMHPLLPQ